MSQAAASDQPVNDTPVAFFDFDGTLTTGDTLMPFLKFVVGKPKYYWNLLLVSPVLIGYFLKLVRNDVAKEAVLKRYLAGYHIDELFTLGERFSEEIIPRMLRPEGMERLRWHQEQGHECVLVSASLDIWLKPWSENNDFIKFITSTLEKNKENVALGTLNGPNCYGKEKEIRTLQWLLKENRKPIWITTYGDSPGDYKLMSVSDSAYLIKSGKVNEFKNIK